MAGSMEHGAFQRKQRGDTSAGKVPLPGNHSEDAINGKDATQQTAVVKDKRMHHAIQQGVDDSDVQQIQKAFRSDLPQAEMDTKHTEKGNGTLICVRDTDSDNITVQSTTKTGNSGSNKEKTNSKMVNEEYMVTLPIVPEIPEPATTETVTTADVLEKEKKKEQPGRKCVSFSSSGERHNHMTKHGKVRTTIDHAVEELVGTNQKNAAAIPKIRIDAKNTKEMRLKKQMEHNVSSSIKRKVQIKNGLRNSPRVPFGSNAEVQLDVAKHGTPNTGEQQASPPTLLNKVCRQRFVGVIDGTYSTYSKSTGNSKIMKPVAGSDDGRPCRRRPFSDEGEEYPFTCISNEVTCSGSAEELEEFVQELAAPEKRHTKGLCFIQDLDVKQVKRGRFVGKGSYGQVWKCEFGSFTVALKQILVEDFRQEEALALYQNPGDVFPTLYCILYMDGVVYLMMEYLPETLWDMMCRKKELTQDWVKMFFFKLLCVLLCLKKGGLCHGDIKAENIGFTRDGNVKLLDCGTVWKQGQYFKTRSGGFTPEFASPQICCARKHQMESHMYDCDVYSAALTPRYLVLKAKGPHKHQGLHSRQHFKLLELIASAAETGLICHDLTLLLQLMLVYDPVQRHTVHQCVAHKVFTDLREQENIPTCEFDSCQRKRSATGSNECCENKDQRIAELEEQNQKLLKQLQAMREEDSGFNSTPSANKI